MAEENWKSEAKRAKEIGNCLIVAVSTNKLVRTYKSYDPILNYRERAAIVGAVRYVDKVVKQTRLFDVDQFNKLEADIFIVGDDWANRNDIPDGLSTTYIKRKIIKQSYEIIYAEVERKLRNQYNNNNEIKI